MTNEHKPVLLQESIEALNIRKDGTYIDATFGFGGHSRAILDKLGGKGKLIGLELDKEIYDQAKNLFKSCKNLSLYNCNFINVARFALSDDVDKVDGILFDLGTNLYQIKQSGRGFSFLKDETLDMRMDLENDITAEKIVNSYSREKLEEILKNVDERRAFAIARAITETRRRKRIKTTFELSEIVQRVKRRQGKTHPATLTFMALRMEVNDEIENLKKALEHSLKILKGGGRLVVISFHSGEDRIVKNFFKDKGKSPEGSGLKIINKKVITAGREEQIKNPLSRSAKIRVAEHY